LRVRQRSQRALGKRVPACVHMDMGVDHPGEHGRRTEIKHPRTGRQLNGGADIGNAITGDQHDLIVQDVS